MKINFIRSTANSSMRDSIKPIFDVLCKEFLEEYDIKEYYGIPYITTDLHGQRHFCDWVCKKGYLNIKPYRMIQEDGELIANGFDITEDEKLTFLMLKHST